MINFKEFFDDLGRFSLIFFSFAGKKWEETVCGILSRFFSVVLEGRARITWLEEISKRSESGGF